MEVFEIYRKLLNLCFTDPPRNVPDVWMKLINKYPVDIITITNAHTNEIVGCVTVVLHSDKVFGIEWTVVHPDHQKRGFGTHLMDIVHGMYSGVFVVKTNNASGFYESLGYKKIYREGNRDVLVFANGLI